MLREKIKVILGITAGVLAFGGLAFGLSQIVVSDNNALCEKIGLSGNLMNCSVNEKYAYDRIAILVGNTANSPAPMISDVVKKYVNNSAFGKDDFQLDIYSATPNMPKVSYDFNGDRPEEFEDGLESEVEWYSGKIDGINKRLAEAKPIENGVDYYETMVKLGKKLSKDDEAKKKLLVVIGSGLSDSGPLNFATNGISGDISNVIGKVNEADKINSEALEGVKIVWSYLGQVIHPQTKLSPAEEDNLKNTYESLADRMGVKTIEFDSAINTNTKSVETDFKVKTTLVKDTSISWGTKNLDSTNGFMFKSDSAELVDRDTAASVLDDVAIELNSNNEKIVTITSYQARLCNSDTEVPNHNLLDNRSNTIKNLLLEKGVSSSRISIYQGGFGKSAKCLDESDRYVTVSVTKGSKG